MQLWKDDHSPNRHFTSPIVFLTVVLAVFLASPDAEAGIMQYTITIDITDAPLVPGSFASNPWDNIMVPQSYVGTFDADDMVAGPISNLNLTVAGLDIASTHPGVVDNLFDPLSLVIAYLAVDPTAIQSAVSLGNPNLIGTPINYAVAVQNTTTGVVDPFYGFDQNWVGSYTIAPSNAGTVPEPSAFAIFATICLMAGSGRRRRKID